MVLCCSVVEVIVLRMGSLRKLECECVWVSRMCMFKFNGAMAVGLHVER